MSHQIQELVAPDHHKILVRHWSPASNLKPKAVVHIVHGMAEHSERYNDTAKTLVRSGIHVISHDHRGHGTLTRQEDLGIYALQHGWELVKSDLKQVQTFIAEKFSDLPVFLLGHSMGSFISMAYLMDSPLPLAGAILSGSNYDNPVRYKALKIIVKAEKIRLGKTGKSSLIEHLSFGSFNKPFEPSEQGFDWLSRDPAYIKAYNDDPFCGFLCSCQLWDDLLSGLIAISKPKNIKKIPQNLPIYLFSGSEDPVGNKGKGVATLASKLLLNGVKDVSCKIYEGGRHEMMNETNKKEVVSNLLHWIKLKQEESALIKSIS